MSFHSIADPCFEFRCLGERYLPVRKVIYCRPDCYLHYFVDELYAKLLSLKYSMKILLIFYLSRFFSCYLCELPTYRTVAVITCFFRLIAVFLIRHSSCECDSSKNQPPTSVADPDAGSGAFLTPGSGMGKKSGSGSGINNRDHISESLETIFGVKIIKFFDLDPGSGIFLTIDPGSGVEKNRIWDKHPGSATLPPKNLNCFITSGCKNIFALKYRTVY
jgi:hypothetical protein